MLARAFLDTKIGAKIARLRRSAQRTRLLGKTVLNSDQNLVF
jgi:hypothetical protein